LPGAKLPPGAALARTDVVTHQMVQIAHTWTVWTIMPAYAGFNALQFVNTPNLQASYVILKPFDQRRRTAAQINAESMPSSRSIKDGFAYALLPPPIQGLGNGSAILCTWRIVQGWVMARSSALDKFQAAIAQTPGMAIRSAPTRRTSRSLEVRWTARAGQGPGVALTDLFDTLTNLTWAPSTSTTSTCSGVSIGDGTGRYQPSATRGGYQPPVHAQQRGEMVPIGSMVTVVPATVPIPVMRYNSYPAADLIGDADPKSHVLRQMIAKLQEIAHKVLPRGIVLEWTDLSYQQVNPEYAAVIVFPLPVMLAFLVLAPCTKVGRCPWRCPDVPVCMCAACSVVWLSGRRQTMCSCRSAWWY